MRRRTVLWVLGLLGGALLLEVALVLVVTGSSDRAGTANSAVASAREFVFGDGKSPNVVERVASVAGDLAGEAGDVVFGDSRPRQGVGTKDPAKFAKCLSCHQDYATKVQSTASLIDHVKHAELGIGCADCHVDTAHPDPLPPSEKGCAKCHDVDSQESCDLCHLPGSLPHFYKLGIPRDGVVECDSCHPPGTFDTGGGSAPLPTISPSDKASCTRCHEPQTCVDCHGASGTKGGRGPQGGLGPHPPDWIQEHGPETIDNGSGGCAECHKSSCAEGCHGDAARIGQYGGEGEEE